MLSFPVVKMYLKQKSIKKKYAKVIHGDVLKRKINYLQKSW